MGEPIYLSIEGRNHRLKPSIFLNSLMGFSGLLRELDASISRQIHGAMNWEIVSLQKNSPATVGIIGRPKKQSAHDLSHKIYSDCIEGINALSAKGERLPAYSEKALNKTERLAKLSTMNLEEMRIFISGHEALIQQRTLANILALRDVHYEGYGSIRGTLDSITVHNNHEFRVWSDVTKKPVTCRFESTMLDAVKGSLKKHVSVYGSIKWNHVGIPISVAVKEVEIINDESIPTIMEMSGLIDNYTDGKDLKDYMEELRNG